MVILAAAGVKAGARHASKDLRPPYSRDHLSIPTRLRSQLQQNAPSATRRLVNGEFERARRN
jgi:hypothetical protein